MTWHHSAQREGYLETGTLPGTLKGAATGASIGGAMAGLLSAPMLLKACFAAGTPIRRRIKGVWSKR